MATRALTRGWNIRYLTRAMLALTMAALGLVATSPAAGAAPNRITEMRIDGVINVFTADYIVSGLDSARNNGSNLVLIGMDTPGGVDTSMRRIIQAILASALPVAVYVSPSGARAASAGLYISQAADVVAMAPGTNIGSAHPVFLDTGTGQGSSGNPVEDQKVLNDSVAYIQGLARLHGRNEQWAVDAVKNSVNVPAEQAVQLHVADLLSADQPALLRQIDGRQVTKHGQELTIHTGAAAVDEQQMGFVQGLLHSLADPQIAYLLMLLAILCIGFEVTHPGAVLPGVIGVIAGALALVAFESLPVNYAGIALVVFGLILFAVDVTAPSHGVLTAGGVISLVLGSYLILDAGAPFLQPNLYLAIFPPAVVGLILAFLISRAVAARRRPKAAGKEALVGSEGEARDDFGPGEGMVFVDGALWTARTSVPLAQGTRVKVTAVDGLTLLVEPVAGGPTEYTTLPEPQPGSA